VTGVNEEAFLSALHESPSDEVTWLALSDWLDEHGQADRAELLRLSRPLRALPVMERTDERAAAEDRLIALLAAGTRPVVPELVNDVGMRFALVPPGRFRMGSPRNETNRGSDETPHEVTITRSFYLGVVPVTQAHYRAVMRGNPSCYTRTSTKPPLQHLRRKIKDVPDEELERFPVEQVTWLEAQEFLDRLSKLPESRRRGWRYRLPSEAEWEYACRAGTTTPFHFGKKLSSTQANFDGNRPYGKSKKGPALDRPCPVGSFLPNAFGLYDVHGQVLEWCNDWYGEYDAEATDPTGPPTGSQRVYRGGSFCAAGWVCRSAFRGKTDAGLHNPAFGFRAALDVGS
jgi:uncharacterized protein (TIGR02996 family)